MKKMITIGLLLIFLVTLTAGTLVAIDPKDNETITMNGIKFDAPKTGNYTIDSTKAPDGTWTWTYTDREHDLWVYVCDERAFEYDLQEQWSDLDGYNQMRPVGDKWVVVCSEYRDVKDMVFMSARSESEP